MKAQNIYLQYHYKPIYKFKIFKDKYIGRKFREYFLIIQFLYQFISTYQKTARICN